MKRISERVGRAESTDVPPGRVALVAVCGLLALLAVLSGLPLLLDALWEDGELPDPQLQVEPSRDAEAG